MLRRKINENLKIWKNSPNHKPLIIKGCRQCGKTHSVLEFAKNNYENFVYLNFFENKDYAAIFSGSLEINHLVMMISAMVPTAKFIPGKTVIILDEIQECPEARTALKFFKEDGRYDVIGTGSLLGIKGYSEKARSIPVGSETVITMYPLDFEEFLWANDIGNEIIEYLKTCLVNTSVIPEPLHKRLYELLLQYTVVGGMPEVVQHFVNTKQINEVWQLQQSIINSYADDMVKYAEKKDKSLIKECFFSIPQQLSKENKKFQYSLITNRGTADKFAGSLQWIEDAGIISRCYNLNKTELPLSGNANKNVFKVYMCDTGLFVSMLEQGTAADILQGNLLGYKGAIFENLAADILIKMGRSLYYFRKDSGIEVAFFIRYHGECIPLEIKAQNGNIKSTKTLLKHPEIYHIKQAIKLGNYNIGKNEYFLTLPLYMLFLLTDY